MVIAAIIIVSAILCFLIIKLYIDYYKRRIKKVKRLNWSIDRLTQLDQNLQKTVEEKQQLLDKQSELLLKIQQTYKENINNVEDEIKEYRDQRKQDINYELEIEYENKKSELEKNYNELVRQCRDESTQLHWSLEQTKIKTNNELQEINNNLEQERAKFQAVIAPIQQLEKEQQDKLFYTIQIPEEYRDDINFLLNEVSLHINHPDILSKLVWSEYIKPYLDDTFKRVGIESKPGIYKITNRSSGKAYIGKSTDVKKRISDHFRSVVGVHTIADQAVHHEILKSGIWEWMIEIITYCDKEQLSEMEKYYINFFQTQEWGYNKKEGG